MNRRHFLKTASAAACAVAARGWSQEGKADFTLHIDKVSFEIAPGHTVKTIGYNGMVPGPLLRMREGRPVSIDVYNHTSHEEIVHWHGLFLPSLMDGAMEEGSPMIPAGGYRRYSYTPQPAGTRWYHTHAFAGRNLERGLYTGQFGFLIIDPKDAGRDHGNYDQEILLALREWEPYLTTMGEDGSLEAGYRAFSINDRALGHGEPIRVKQGQRVLMRILNASATQHRRIALAGHTFQVVALDGNPVPTQARVAVLQLGPAERVDAVVEMERPGVWVLGELTDATRRDGLGIVVEYAGQKGPPQWIAPPQPVWDYSAFGAAAQAVATTDTAIPVPLVFRPKFAGHNWFDYWTINGKSWPKTTPVMLTEGKRYRLLLENQSGDPHPIHLHRHTFELVGLAGRPTRGVYKDVVVVPPQSQFEVEFAADHPGDTLFHCHQQMHMDFGFMMLFRYH